MPGEFFRKQNPVHQFAQNVAHGDMGFLNAGRHVGRYGQCFVRQITGFSTPAGHGQSKQAGLSGDLQTLDDIGGIAAGADAPGDIVLLTQPPDLFGKNMVEAVVVTRCWS